MAKLKDKFNFTVLQGARYMKRQLRSNSLFAKYEHNLTAHYRQHQFENILKQQFGPETAKNVLQVFEKLQLPPPGSNTEFLDAYEGTIHFLSLYGVVIRVEHTSENAQLTKDYDCKLDRINNSPWVLAPLATIPVGNAIIEICAGTHTTDDTYTVPIIYQALQEEGIRFNDHKVANVGILPIKTDNFPNGIPVVIDRLAVARLSEAIGDISASLKKMGLNQNPQDILYGDLRQSFNDAWPEGQENPDPIKMRHFWTQCAEKQSEGKLVPGWNEENKDKNKRRVAKNAAAAYAQKLTPSH